MRSESIPAAAQSLAEQVAGELRKAVQARGQASLLVPGGRTPVPFFRALRRLSLAWSQVTISLTDERWVGEDQADSNARLVRAELLVDNAATATFIPLHNAAPTATQGAASSWRALGVMPRPYDVVVLGMGDDGHFASLFPDSPGLDAALDPSARPACVAMRAPSKPVDRVSLNLAALADAGQLLLFITGEHKRLLLESRGARGPLPVDALLALSHPQPVVYWAP